MCVRVFQKATLAKPAITRDTGGGIEELVAVECAINDEPANERLHCVRRRWPVGQRLLRLAD
jgi:hypothetical protein